MPSFILVTATNHKYMPLALDLLNSIQTFKGVAPPFDIGVYDVGLEKADYPALEKLGCKIVKPGVDIEYPGREKWEAEVSFTRAMMSRPFLPKYFPDYDYYLWMDADTWLQTPEFLEQIFPSLERTPLLHIAPEFDRDYIKFYDGMPVWQIFLDWYRAMFPQEIIDRMVMRPMLNSGVWGMPADCAVWEKWASVCEIMVNRVPELQPVYMLVEQLSLNVAVYLNQIPFMRLPAEDNWVCLLGMPIFDMERKLFLRPSVPHNPISVLHIAGETKLQHQTVDKMGGGEITLSMRRPILI